MPKRTLKNFAEKMAVEEIEDEERLQKLMRKHQVSSSGGDIDTIGLFRGSTLGVPTIVGVLVLGCGALLGFFG